MLMIIELRKVQVNQAKILNDVHRIRYSSCAIGSNLHMWEDGMYLTRQSNDVDTSLGAWLLICRDSSKVISSKLNIWNTWLAGKGI